MTAPSILDRPERITIFANYVERVVDKSGECWLWTLRPNGAGYGTFYLWKGVGKSGKRRTFCTMAHRAAWEIANGERIPEGLVIDHLCDVKLCVNPAHLAVATQSENTKRGPLHNRLKEKCPRGHEYDRVESWEDSRSHKTIVARRCSRCRREQEGARSR